MCQSLWNDSFQIINSLIYEQRAATQYSGAFQLAVQELASINSGLVSLRSHLHVDLAKLYEFEMLYGRARQQVWLASALVQLESGLETFKLEQIDPMIYRLDVKMSPYVSRLTEDKIFFLLEQAAIAPANTEMHVYLISTALEILIPGIQINLTKELNTDLPALLVQPSIMNSAQENQLHSLRQRLRFEHGINIMILAKNCQLWIHTCLVASWILNLKVNHSSSRFYDYWTNQAALCKAESFSKSVDPSNKMHVGLACDFYLDALNCVMKQTDDGPKRNSVTSVFHRADQYFTSIADEVLLSEVVFPVLRQFYDHSRSALAEFPEMITISAELLIRGTISMSKYSGGTNARPQSSSKKESKAMNTKKAANKVETNSSTIDLKQAEDGKSIPDDFLDT